MGIGRDPGAATTFGSADGCACAALAEGRADTDADGATEATGTEGADADANADAGAGAGGDAAADVGVAICGEDAVATSRVLGRSPPSQAVTPALTLANAKSAGTSRSAGNHCSCG